MANITHPNAIKPQRDSAPITPGSTEPRPDKRITLTMTELDELVAKRVTFALEAAGVPAAAKPGAAPAKVLPTIEQAKAMVEVDLARGIPVKGIQTQDGWYVHPRANNVEFGGV